MGEHAFNSLASQPISSMSGIQTSADYKKQMAMMNAAATTRRIYETVEAYQKRMAEFQAKLTKERLETRTQEAEKQYAALQKIDLFSIKDPQKLQYAMSDYETLFRYNQFNQLSNFDNKIFTAKKQYRQILERKENLENGEDKSPSTVKNYAAADFQKPGERDFLS